MFLGFGGGCRDVFLVTNDVSDDMIKCSCCFNTALVTPPHVQTPGRVRARG